MDVISQGDREGQLFQLFTGGELACMWVTRMWWQWGYSHSLDSPRGAALLAPPTIKGVPLAPRGLDELVRAILYHLGAPQQRSSPVCMQGIRQLIWVRYSRSFTRGKDFARLSLPKLFDSNHCKELKLWVGSHAYFSSYKVWEVK